MAVLIAMLDMAGKGGNEAKSQAKGQAKGKGGKDQATSTSSSEELEACFRRGYGAKARAHQVEAVKGLLGLLRWNPGATTGLIQHAPGAGKTETILLLAYCALRENLVDRVVVLNYGVDLEEQFQRRARSFFVRLGAPFPVRRAASTAQLPELLAQRGLVLSLLQKFAACPGQGALGRALVVIDEAHRGIPEEGTFIQNVDAALGGAAKVLFTATPRADTLRRFGTLRCDAASDSDGLFRAPFHTYTQRDAIRSGASLNPLEKYVSAVSQVELHGVRLAGTAVASLADFVEGFHARRGSQEQLAAWASHVLAQLPRVDADMPEMLKQGHVPKKLLVLGEVQEVYDMAAELRSQIARRGLTRATGEPLRVACFFSGKVRGHSDQGANFAEFNRCDEAGVLDEADLVVVCQKYTTGWDEWRVVAVFLLRRLGSEELLQQLLGRATRTRPGTGKRRPWVFDYMNDPDWVFSAAARFYGECRGYPDAEGGGELFDLSRQIGRFFDEPHRPWQEAAALRLPLSDRALLRAAAVRYLAIADAGGDDGPLDVQGLRALLLVLNVSMRAQLFGGSAALAERSATSGCSAAVRAASAALRALRRATHALAAAQTHSPAAAGRLVATPAKRARSPEEGPAPPPKRGRGLQGLPTRKAESAAAAQVAEAMELCSDRLLVALTEHLGRLGPPSDETEPIHLQYLADAQLAASPLQHVYGFVREGLERIRERLAGPFAAFLGPWLEEWAAACERDFEATARNTQDDYAADLQTAVAAYARSADKVGGRRGAELRSAFAGRLGRAVSSKLHRDRQELLRGRSAMWEEAERIAAAPDGGERRGELDGVLRSFRELADGCGGQQAACFKRSFEESMRRRGLLAPEAPAAHD